MPCGVFAAAKKDLARLAILNFADETGTKNYGYLPHSLTEAIDRSLQQKFEYLREDPGAFAAAGAMDPERAAAFARSNNLDIVVHGSFTLDRSTKEVLVTTYLSFGGSAKFRRLKERKNPADATIFSLAEKVADDIVAEMTEVAKTQSTEKSVTTETGKLELKKENVTSWESKKWYISAEAGIAGPLSNNEGLSNGLGVTLRINRDLWRRMYIGGELGFAFTESQGNGCSGSICAPSGNNFEAGYATGVLGYAFYPGNRWRIFADVGAGTARGGFREDAAQGKTDQTRFVLRAAIGVDFLITESVSIGLGIRLTTFPGSGESFAFGQPAGRIAYGF